MRKSRINSFRSDPQINWEQCGYRAANLIHWEISDDKASNLPTVSNWIFCLILLNGNKEHNYEKTMPFLLETKHFSSPTFILSHRKFQAKQLCNWTSKVPHCFVLQKSRWIIAIDPKPVNKHWQIHTVLCPTFFPVSWHFRCSHLMRLVLLSPFSPVFLAQLLINIRFLQIPSQIF